MYFETIAPKNFYQACVSGFAEGAIAVSLFAHFCSGIGSREAMVVGFTSGIATGVASGVNYQLCKLMGWNRNFDGMGAIEATASVTWPQAVVGAGLELGAAYFGYHYAVDQMKPIVPNQIQQQLLSVPAPPVRILQNGNRFLANIPT